MLQSAVLAAYHNYHPSLPLLRMPSLTLGIKTASQHHPRNMIKEATGKHQAFCDNWPCFRQSSPASHHWCKRIIITHWKQNERSTLQEKSWFWVCFYILLVREKSAFLDWTHSEKASSFKFKDKSSYAKGAMFPSILNTPSVAISRWRHPWLFFSWVSRSTQTFRCMCYNLITGCALSDLQHLYTPSCSLRSSSDIRMLKLQRLNHKTQGFLHTYTTILLHHSLVIYTPSHSLHSSSDTHTHTLKLQTTKLMAFTFSHFHPHVWNRLIN